MPFEPTPNDPTTRITLPRSHWHAAYREASVEASEMAWQKEWVGTALRQDYLSVRQKHGSPPRVRGQHVRETRTRITPACVGSRLLGAP